MLFLAASTAIALKPPQVSALAKATVTIERPAKASREEWDRIPPSSRREMIVRDERGQLVLMRVVDYQ